MHRFYARTRAKVKYWLDVLKKKRAPVTGRPLRGLWSIPGTSDPAEDDSEDFKFTLGPAPCKTNKTRRQGRVLSQIVIAACSGFGSFMRVRPRPRFIPPQGCPFLQVEDKCSFTASPVIVASSPPPPCELAKSLFPSMRSGWQE
jgi:hypothetical protein